MYYKRIISLMVLLIVIFALVATLAGIITNEGPGPFEFESIHGHRVLIYGRGVYKHMSLELAPQGIAQDYVTLLVGIPLLVFSLILSNIGSLKGRILLTGTLGYFLVSYLFYLVMGMYNELFLVYIALTFLSFYAFLLNIIGFDLNRIKHSFSDKLPVKFLGGLLIVNSLLISLMWLSRVIPPLIEGTIPLELEHYTTLIVQGLDLAILLPGAFIAGVLIIRKNKAGYLLAPIYIVFLSILMTALTGKIIGQLLIGVGVGAAIVIIPSINIVTWFSTIIILKNVSKNRLLSKYN